MAEADTKFAILLARLAVALTVGLIVLGAVWYGFSAEVYHRFWRDIYDRPGGPMTFRFILQPSMAAMAAWHDGFKDARTGRLPYLRTVLTNSSERGDRLREGLISTARIILLGLAMDTIYQYAVLGRFYPDEAVLVALLLAFIPYLLLRGPIARIVRWCDARKSLNSKS